MVIKKIHQNLLLHMLKKDAFPLKIIITVKTPMVGAQATIINYLLENLQQFHKNSILKYLVHFFLYKISLVN